MSKKETKSARAGKRLNKKVLVVFLAAVIAVALSSFLGVMTASGARKVSNLTQFDRILFWNDGQRGTWEQNMALGNNAGVKYWQPIEQKYGLGQINMDSYAPKFWSKTAKNKTTAKIVPIEKNLEIGCLASRNIRKKTYTEYADYIDGASFMGELYDMRQYFWSVTGNASVLIRKPGAHSPFGHNHGIHDNGCDDTGAGEYMDGYQVAVASEVHFYPRGTLQQFELSYRKESGGSEPCSESEQGIEGCTCRTENVPVAPTPGAPVVPGAPTPTIPVTTCTRSDRYAYYKNPTDKSPAYTGAYYDKNGNFRYSAKDYEKELKKYENKTKQFGQPDGEFSGTTFFSDIDTWYAERYTPLSGVNSVFTTYNSRESARKESFSGVTGSAVYKEYCPNRTKNDICYYSWGGAGENQSGSPGHWVYFNFTSTSERPLILIYSGRWHGSSIGSSSTKVAYVLVDDANDLPDGVLDEIENFAQEYKELYGRELREDQFFKDNPGIEPEQVIRLFSVFSFSEYDPYLINKYLANLEDLNGQQLNWYSCSSVAKSCLIPYDEELSEKHNKPNEVTGTSKGSEGNTIEYINGYDFIKGEHNSKIYYASVFDALKINFDNTCYSDNNTPVETEDYDR